MDKCTAEAHDTFQHSRKKSVLFHRKGKHPMTCIDTSCINHGFEDLEEYCKKKCGEEGSYFVTVASCVPDQKCGSYQ